MSSENTFNYNYSAAAAEEAQAIKSKYMPKETGKLDELKALDKKVRKPADVFSYVFGAISAIIMGCGMSLVMTDIGAIVGVSEPMLPGIVIGVVGIVLAIINYPMHKAILGARRKKYADKIIELSDELMNG